jgi:hypothetical protein
MFVVDFVGPSDPTCIPVVSIAEHFKALMNKNIMNEKIGQSISKNAKSNREASPKTIAVPTDKAKDTHDSVKNKERIIAFPPTSMVFVMMVFMEDPQKAMHNVLMGKPGHKFHNGKRAKKD